MSTIILTWEYERDASHLSRLQYLQKQLIQMGHQAYLIGASLPPLEEGEVLPYLPAPRAPAFSVHKPRALTKIGGFSDRLALLGFNDAKVLRTLVAAWDNLFALLKPSFLICDCAPVASLAAYKTIPCIQLSDGLSLPPHHLTDFPRLRPDATPLASSHEMLKNVQLVQAQRNKNVPPYLPAFLQSEYSFISHLPEFDPYLTFRDKSTKHGPFSRLPAYPFYGDKNTFFAYLDMTYPEIEEIIIGLTDLEKTGIFFIPGASYALQQFLIQRGMIVYHQLPAFDEILTECAFVVHHGNISVAEAALAAGIPQFTLPAQFESSWVSHYLVEIGVGLSIYSGLHPIAKTPKKIKAALEIKENHKKSMLREWSSLRAQHLKQKNYTPLEASIIHACQQLLR